MTQFNRGGPTAFAVTAIILFALTGVCFLRQDVSSRSMGHLTGHSLSITANRTVSGSRNTTPAAIAGLKSSDLVVKRAIQFGHEAAPAYDFFELFNRTQHELPKRVVTVTLEQAIANGLAYWEDMDSGGHQSHWLRIEDMTGNEDTGNKQESSRGWSLKKGGSGFIVADLRNAFNELHIPGPDDANMRLILSQDQIFHRCGASRPKTDAINDGVYNVRGKTIVAAFNYSPQFKLRQKLKVKRLSDQQASEGLPQVTRWSDIVWINWSDSGKLDASEASALKYIFRHDVITDNTVFIIEQILGLSRNQFPNGGTGAWPGSKFKPGQNNFWALLGTDHGRGVTNLIRDHQGDSELRGKSIESITVFRADDPLALQWHMLFTLTGPENEPLKDPSQMVPPDSDSDSDSEDDDSDSDPPTK